MTETWHQCDCGIYVSSRGNEQWDAPHNGSFEKIEGSCDDCVRTLTRLGVIAPEYPSPKVSEFATIIMQSICRIRGS
jgi:hypothetical protein